MVLRWFGGKWGQVAKLFFLAGIGGAVLLAATEPSEARRRHGYKTHFVKKKAQIKKTYRTRRHAIQAYNPRFASIVVDIKSGRALQETDADSPRHPASITKVMTLYMLFEQLDAGRLTLDSRLPVSSHAAAQAPTKLGLRAGGTLRVEDAIKGMVTRSANDAAVVVAEAIGGTEERFAQMMTRRARSLGMSRTSYYNASGLPDPRQVTTARDLAKLGVAIQDRFPRYFQYFSTRTFVYNGRAIGNHNRLLGQVEGVDGIKTGYTRASGFNLLTSVKRDNCQLVAVVLGGRSGSSRDAAMREMIARTLPRAYAGPRQMPVYAAAAPVPSVPAPAATASPAAAPRIRPAVVAEVVTPQAAPLLAPVRLASLPTPSPMKRSAPKETRPVEIGMGAGAPQTTVAAPAQPATGMGIKTVRAQNIVVAADITASLPAKAEVSKPPEQPRAARKGWIIQIGAPETESQARALLAKAQSTGHRAISSAEPFTEPTEKNGVTFWRARFAGFQDARGAQNACAALKSRDFDCMPARL